MTERMGKTDRVLITSVSKELGVPDGAVIVSVRIDIDSISAPSGTLERMARTDEGYRDAAAYGQEKVRV
jgi:hypothetical protein